MSRLINKTLLLTFSSKGISAIGSMFLLVILANYFGPEGLGVYALAQSIILANSIIARYGMGTAILKIVSKNPTSKLVRKFYKLSLFHCFISCFLLGTVSFLTKDMLSIYFNVESLSELLKGMLIALPAFSVAFILAAFMKAIKKPALACLLENGAVSLITTILIVLFLDEQSQIESVGYLYALASWVICLCGMVLVKAHLKKVSKVNVSKIEWVSNRKYFYKISGTLFIINLAGFIQSVLVILISAKLLDVYDLGLLKTALQIGTIVSFVLVVINAIYPAKFSKLYHDNENDKLEKTAKKSAMLSLVLVSPFLTLALIFPAELLNLLGPDFVEAKDILRIIAIAQFVNTATGSVGFLLNMTGNEKIMRNIIIFSNTIGICLLIVLIQSFGLLGAALGVSFSIMLQNIIAVYFVKIKLNFWILPFPNLQKER